MIEKQNGEADPRLASSRLHDDIERLEAQAALSWGRELRFLQRLGLRDGMSVLDVGSGPGSVAERILAAFPHCAITAVEPDPRMAALARERLGTRAYVVQTSIGMTPLDDDSFDFALARFVFQHLAAPDIALAEIHRLLKPNGTLAIIDIDDDLGGLIVPALPTVRLAFHNMRNMQRHSGGDRNIGRKLWRLLQHAGFQNLDLAALVIHSDDVGIRSFAAQYDPERVRSWLSDDELARYKQEFAQLMHDPEALILEIYLVASGVRL